MKKRVLITGGIIILFAVVFFFLRKKNKGYKSILSPKLSIANVTIKKIRSGKINMEIGVKLKNSSPIDINIDSLDYVVFIDNKVIVESTQPDSISIAAEGEISFSLPLILNIGNLESINENLRSKNKDSAHYKVVLNAYLDNKLIVLEDFEVSVEKKLPIVEIPNVKLNKIGISELNLPTVGLKTIVEIQNPNPFKLELKNVDSELVFSGNKVFEINKSSPIVLAENGTTEVELFYEAQMGEAIESLFEYIKEGTDLPVEFTFYSTINSDSKMLDKASFNMLFNGNVKDL